MPTPQPNIHISVPITTAPLISGWFPTGTDLQISGGLVRQGNDGFPHLLQRGAQPPDHHVGQANLQGQPGRPGHDYQRWNLIHCSFWKSIFYEVQYIMYTHRFIHTHTLSLCFSLSHTHTRCQSVGGVVYARIVSLPPCRPPYSPVLLSCQSTCLSHHPYAPCLSPHSISNRLLVTALLCSPPSLSIYIIYNLCNLCFLPDNFVWYLSVIEIHIIFMAFVFDYFVMLISRQWIFICFFYRQCVSASLLCLCVMGVSACGTVCVCVCSGILSTDIHTHTHSDTIVAMAPPPLSSWWLCLYVHMYTFRWRVPSVIK